MTFTQKPGTFLGLVLAMGAWANCQKVAAQPGKDISYASVAENNHAPGQFLSVSPGVGVPLFADFREADIKFSITQLMRVLQDRRHEGWVLAAYPDPKTKRPLIGAGFSLDLEARDHPQLDPLNPHLFLEPSSVQLWQAAGLEQDRLQWILSVYDRNLKTWSANTYRRKIRLHALAAQITEAEATQLLRISVIQAIYNARAYCRDFDQLTGIQQMALSQLVFQMGVNLEEFVNFLNALNGEGVSDAGTSQEPIVRSENTDRWRSVQGTLIDSQWARLYRDRATTVIAMFDPAYVQDPLGAQRKIEAVLRPAMVHRSKSRLSTLVHANRFASRGAKFSRPASHPARHKRKLA